MTLQVTQDLDFLSDLSKREIVTRHPQEMVLEISYTACGFFVETALIDYARGYRKCGPGDGGKQKLARALGEAWSHAESGRHPSNKAIIDRLMIPVLFLHHKTLVQLTRKPTDEGEPLTEAAAWLTTGAEGRVPSGPEFGPEWKESTPAVAAPLRALLPARES